MVAGGGQQRLHVLYLREGIYTGERCKINEVFIQGEEAGDGCGDTQGNMYS